MSLKGKHIVLGITGSIAAYKSAILTRLLIKKGAELQIVITAAGKEFITPVTLSALSGRPVISEFFATGDGTWHSHVDLGLWADLMLIAPATASTLGKMVSGIADNMLITTYLSMKAPVFVAPAMDLDMFKHVTTQRNIIQLKSDGVMIIDPGVGELASHLEGKGRMEEPENIVKILEDYFKAEQGKTNREQDQTATEHNQSTNSLIEQDLLKKKVLITAGPTYEKIDPVRFIGNYSSGKMGFAIAEECAKRGAEVILVTGPTALSTTNPNIKRIDVESAKEMHNASINVFPQMDIAILSAAVADYRPNQQEDTKIKHNDNEDITIKLTPNPDIAAALGKIKKDNQIIVGFALETNNEENNALKKIEKKNFNFIVLNSLKDAGAGFGVDTNKVTIISKDGDKITFNLKSKSEVAKDIINTTLFNKTIKADIKNPNKLG
ncbi:MAG: bifunctional phosphopantothenoylcysteine decarboxylase/phosphopantothenate--cysteine ligase CoaBC [Fermentimonas sp.]|nr:bifunctional phosphopantothenoylcysteine decarboxylase/phosphopantothenate--cysteine ligase CoaBC [Fermentimonas sp.]